MSEEPELAVHRELAPRSTCEIDSASELWNHHAAEDDACDLTELRDRDYLGGMHGALGGTATLR